MDAFDKEEMQRRMAEACDRAWRDLVAAASPPPSAPEFTLIYGLRGYGGCTMCDAIIHRNTPCDRAGCPKAPKPRPGWIYATHIS